MSPYRRNEDQGTPLWHRVLGTLAMLAAFGGLLWLAKWGLGWGG